MHCVGQMSVEVSDRLADVKDAAAIEMPRPRPTVCLHVFANTAAVTRRHPPSSSPMMLSYPIF